MAADALPDDFGNALIDAWMAERGVTRDEITPLDRLAYMGKRGMGALEFRPAQGSHRESELPLAIEVAGSRKRACSSPATFTPAVLKNPAKRARRWPTSSALAPLQAGRAPRQSSPGTPRRMRFEAGNSTHRRDSSIGCSSSTESAAITRLGTGAEYGRIEYAYHRMALAAGIAMEPCRLLEESGRAHFMTHRFDRDIVAGQTVKHHLQTLCALDHLDFKQRATHSYSQLFMAIVRLELGDGALSQAFRRMAFNVMARNCDDHTKNFSFRLKRGGAWELAPALRSNPRLQPARPVDLPAI